VQNFLKEERKQKAFTTWTEPVFVWLNKFLSQISYLADFMKGRAVAFVSQIAAMGGGVLSSFSNTIQTRIAHRDEEKIRVNLSGPWEERLSVYRNPVNWSNWPWFYGLNTSGDRIRLSLLTSPGLVQAGRTSGFLAWFWRCANRERVHNRFTID